MNRGTVWLTSLSDVKGIILDLELATLATPVVLVEEDVHTALTALRDALWLNTNGCAVGEVDDGHGSALVGFAGVLLQPLAQDLVPTPIANGELLCCEFLVHVAWRSVEDLEQGLWKLVSRCDSEI